MYCPTQKVHRNFVSAERGIRMLLRLPRMTPRSTGRAPDTQMLYRYLKYTIDNLFRLKTSLSSFTITRMSHTPHLSRREILEAIPLLGSGSLLLARGVLYGQRPDTRSPGIIR